MATVWDTPVCSLFQHVLKFYRQEKEHMKLEYGQRIELLALFKQVKLGPYAPDKDTGTGYFDMVGSDRRKAWQNLGAISLEEAQTRVISLLEGVCPQMKEAVLNDYKASVQTALGQTDKSCMEDQQADREREENGIEHQDGSTSPESTSAITSNSSPVASTQSSSPALPSPHQQHRTALAPATLWSKPKATSKFIAELQAQPAAVVPLSLAAGESVALQVPTSPQAAAIVWEFGTLHGDVGFGLSFTRGRGQGEGQEVRDLEQLLPVMLRDCSEDLLLGSHQYQEGGIYTLDFVNSHSTLPKVVYYRVFYQTSSGS